MNSELELKAAVFDILVQQEQLTFQIKELDRQKAQLVQQLNLLQQSQKQDNKE
jgi:hypothetical protein